MAYNLFVYGSLINEEVVKALTGKKFESQKAQIEGFYVSSLADRASPGLVASDEETAEGLVLLDIDDESYKTIFDWESTDYKSISVKAQSELGQIIDCFTFLWNGEALNTPWSNAIFRESHLNWYLEEDIPNFFKSYNT